MDPLVESVLLEYENPDRRSSGALLNILFREAMARSAIEVGCGSGYYTVWLAAAARETGGCVLAIDQDARKIATAKKMLRQAGLADFVGFRQGDALELIDSLRASYDFALIHLSKALYVHCLEKLTSRLDPGAVVVADNMVYPEQQVDESERYRERVRSGGDFESVLLPVGTGLEVARYYGD